MFKNTGTEKTGMDIKIYFQAKSYIFAPHEKFKNSGSDIRLWCLSGSIGSINKQDHGIRRRLSVEPGARQTAFAICVEHGFVTTPHYFKNKVQSDPIGLDQGQLILNLV
jgi:hypothetical protein